ncbi:MAG: MFS transporter [Gammaproteobacteria bacterium]|nr:MFS transporter [Gammaproteobacteria bacterium]
MRDTSPHLSPAFLTWRSPRLGLMLLLGFSSGLPLVLTETTLQAWLTTTGISIETIGWFGLVGWPYLLKPLWAPLLDRYAPPWLGRRRGWMLLTQLGVMLLLVLLALLRLPQQLLEIGIIALLLAAMSATQDIAADAYRADQLSPRERGLGAALWTGGYRLAMLVAGPLALILADQGGFPLAYLCMAAAMTIGLAGTLLAREPAVAVAPLALRAAVLEPWHEFLRRPRAGAVLIAIVLFKLGDAMTVSFQTTFLLRGLGFSLTEVGAISKTVGLAALLAGALLGGALMVRLRLYRALLLFGVLQALSNLGFALLAALGKSYGAMFAVIAFEYCTSGMGIAAFLAWLMALCDKRYSATQFALLSALASVGRVLIGPVAGYLIAAVDWVVFYVIAFAVALPGLWAIARLREVIDRRDD